MSSKVRLAVVAPKGRHLCQMSVCLGTQVGHENNDEGVFKGFVMARKRSQSNWGIGDLTDQEVSAAIHYLDSGSRCEKCVLREHATSVVCLSLIILFLGCVCFILLHHCAS